MAAKIKNLIGAKILHTLKSCETTFNTDLKSISSAFTFRNTSSGKHVIFQLPIHIFNGTNNNVNENLISSLMEKEIFSVTKDVNYKKEKILSFKVDSDYFTNEVLDDKTYYENLISPETSFNAHLIKEKVVIDFSSPNIAKPFHVGHLRSTIIGSFISNLYSFLSHDVVRLTYIGDWGTQFGLLQIGLNKLKLSNEELKSKPIELLFNAYVEGNKLSESDPSIAEEARKVFQRLENGDETEEMERWRKCKAFTVDELTKTYSRLGVKFDEYSWESLYPTKAILYILEQIRAKGILENDNGRQIVKLDSGRSATLLKSDGSSLYLTRDIAAALDRYNRHHFTQMLYIVDNSQTDHFVALKNIATAMDWRWGKKLQHVKFGRVQGMSTRKGQVIFLKDILDEAKEIMRLKQIESQTTRVGVTEETADILGISAVIINDLKQKRLRDYVFNWNTALQTDGDTGIKLQYTHCRLSNLEKNCGMSLPKHCNPKLLQEPEAQLLVQEIASFDEVLRDAHAQLEAYILVKYLFRLCNATSKALKTLNIKYQNQDVGEQRLLLFNRARIVLYRGMKILGLQPLEEM